MDIPVIANRKVFEEALEAARRTGYGPDTVDLNAVVGATLLGRLEDTWDTIESALRRGYEFGREKAKAALDKAITEAEQLLTEAGRRASDIHELLLEKMRGFVQTLVANTFALVPPTISIGNQNYKIEKLTYSWKMLMTGSIQMNLVMVFSLASGGEFGVTVDYAVES